EHAFTFSVGFPPVQFTFQGAQLTPSLPSGTALVLDTNSAAAGRVGITVALPPETTLGPATHDLLLLEFAAGTVSNEVTVALTFENLPVPQQLVDAKGQDLFATFESTLLHLSPTRVEIVSILASSADLV